ncbi:hypothetical protein BJ973_004224 [Actinoplanes tereljensis]|uniref:Ricin-type beta-trefoil lectin protein n=1 Tax=Paractinoplanes tereljensis TaxID=571912 RepID=A0A919TWU6_9ACTN|nr:FG-GAP-like repeat-containing protein [Actinoplanes tereljensis]GIF23615.1 hypothetical protein Ate02nite_63450 [Actinoplanes tereljensis]
MTLAALTLPFVPARPAHAAPSSCPDAAADAGAAAAVAKSCGGGVEALDRRTEASRTVIERDGTATTENYVTPRWVRRADGSWTGLDTTLRRTGDTLTPVATLLPVTFSAGGSGPFATIASGTRSVALTWPAPLPEPVVAGPSATYPEVLPGVDLKVTALAQGFSEVLVVKSAAAAANPKLSTVTFGTSANGVKLSAAADGGVRAVDGSGAEVFTSPRAMMWDASGNALTGAPPRMRAMGERLDGANLHVVPDKGFLADPATRYPVSIDPIFTGGKSGNAWSVVASRSDLAGSAFWQRTFMSNAATYGDAGAGLTCDSYTGNTCNSTPYVVRSLFRMETYGAAGATVLSSNFEITQKWSWTCNTASNAKLWITGGISSTTTWNSQPFWDGHTAEAAGNHAVGNANGCAGPGTVSFDATGLVQYGFSQGWSDLTLGLRAVNEGTNLQWKRFDSGTAVLRIRYDHAPAQPSLGDLRVGPSAETVCGASAASATHVNTTNGLKLSAVLTDADAGLGDLVRARWSVTGVAPQYAPLDEAAGLTSGSAHATTIPAAAFADGAAVSWQVQGLDTDSGMAGAPSPSCYLVVDNVAPQPPALSSTDLILRIGLGIPPPVGPHSIAGQSAAVTFAPAGADAGRIVGYRYGVAADADAALGQWVPAGLGGTATATVVPPPALAYASLSVASVKADGTIGTATTARFRADPATGTPHVPGDATGDGRADLTVAGDVGGGRSTLWRWGSTAAPAVFGPAQAPQGNAGIYVNGQFAATPGDFDGDGRSDVATFTQSGSDALLSVQRSDGNQLLSSPELRRMAGWQAGKIKAAAGDFNADGKDDVLAAYDNGNGWLGYLFVATGGPEAPAFAAPLSFTGGAFGWSTIAVAVGDFDGDQRADVYEISDAGSCGTEMRFHQTSATLTSGWGQLRYSSGANTLCWGPAKFVAGDFNHDGRADLAATVDRTVCQTQLWRWTTADASTLGAPVTAWDSGPNAWCTAAVTPQPGDFNGDGNVDIGLVYRCCGPYQAQAWTALSTGPGFAAPVEVAAGGLGPVGAASVDLDTRLGTGQTTYQVVNASAGTCADDTTGLLVGQPCAPTTHQLVTVERRGAQYVSIHPKDNPAACYDINYANSADQTPIGPITCHGVATQLYMLAQYWTVEYLSGPPSAPAVRLTTPLSGKCFDLDNARATPGTTIWEYGCNGGIAQSWFLRPVAAG